MKKMIKNIMKFEDEVNETSLEITSNKTMVLFFDPQNEISYQMSPEEFEKIIEFVKNNS